VKSYSLFTNRLIPARASSQAWIMVVVTMGLLALFPILTGHMFFTRWNKGAQEIAENWEKARPESGIGGMMTIPSHLSGYETRVQNQDRIIFGLTLGEILKNTGSYIGPGFNGDAMRQKITLTFFRPDQSAFSLSEFFKLYGSYLENEKRVGGNGLTTQNFLRDGPFDNEILRYETGYNQARYLVRCYDGSRSNRLNTCFRNLKISDDLALRYSFDERLLTNWVGLESVIVALARRMIHGRQNSHVQISE